MFERGRWVFLVMGLVVLWQAWHGAGGKNRTPASEAKTGTVEPAKPDSVAALTSAKEDAGGANSRESTRHMTDAIEREMHFRNQQRQMQLEAQLSSLLKYDGEQLMVYAAALEVPDNPIKVLYPQYQELTRELDALKAAGLGEVHPTRKAKQAEVDAMKQQLDEGVAKLRAGMKAQVEAGSKSR